MVIENQIVWRRRRRRKDTLVIQIKSKEKNESLNHYPIFDNQYCKKLKKKCSVCRSAVPQKFQLGKANYKRAARFNGEKGDMIDGAANIDAFLLHQINTYTTSSCLRWFGNAQSPSTITDLPSLYSGGDCCHCYKGKEMRRKRQKSNHCQENCHQKVFTNLKNWTALERRNHSFSNDEILKCQNPETAFQRPKEISKSMKWSGIGINSKKNLCNTNDIQHLENLQDSTEGTSFYSAEESTTKGEADSTLDTQMAEHGHQPGTARGSSGGSGTSGERRSSISFERSGNEFNGRRYHLRVIQQPSIGCAFGNNRLSRLAIAPPLIVQLRVTDLQNRDVDFDDEIPFLVCRINLTTEDGRKADLILPASSTIRQASAVEGSLQAQQQMITRSRRASRITTSEPPAASSSTGGRNEFPQSTLYGTLVASPSRLPDVRQQLRTFFIFPEVSVRQCGRFKLLISLMRIQFPLPIIPQSINSREPTSTQEASISAAATNTSPGARQTSPMLISTTTDTFDVVDASEYVAPHITDITRHFSNQGVGLLLPPHQSGMSIED